MNHAVILQRIADGADDGRRRAGRDDGRGVGMANTPKTGNNFAVGIGAIEINVDFPGLEEYRKRMM